MYLHLEKALVYANGKFDRKSDFLINIGENLSCAANGSYGVWKTLDLKDGNYIVVPGFADVHVHLREPGFSYKETISAGTKAAARGGYTAVCTMPNLNPAPDCAENLKKQFEIIEKDAAISVVPYGTITKGENGEELSDMAGMLALAENCIEERTKDADSSVQKAYALAGFSDDGRGVQSAEMMKKAMTEAKKLGKIIAAHCEDDSIPGEESASEWKQIERDIELARETGCAYHVCHISTMESAELIRRAKTEGVDITCETAPHYLLLDESMRSDDGCFKMNPPLRKKKDREALLEALKDGTIDMIATDHAPHSAEEKARGFAGSVMGVVGLETAFPVLYTELVKTGAITLEELVKLMNENPRKRFGLEQTGFSVWELDEEYEINPEEFASLGKSTPFTGKRVYGRCIATINSDKVAWVDEAFLESHKRTLAKKLNLYR